MVNKGQRISWPTVAGAGLKLEAGPSLFCLQVKMEGGSGRTRPDNLAIEMQLKIVRHKAIEKVRLLLSTSFKDRPII